MSIVAIVLIQQVERTRLGLSTTTVPRRSTQSLGRVAAGHVAKHRLEGLGPLHAVVEPFELPQFLQEVQDRAVCIG